MRGSASGLVKYQITASEGILSDRSQIRVHLIVMRGYEDRLLEVRSSEDGKFLYVPSQGGCLKNPLITYPGYL